MEEKKDIRILLSTNRANLSSTTSKLFFQGSFGQLEYTFKRKISHTMACSSKLSLFMGDQWDLLKLTIMEALEGYLSTVAYLVFFEDNF